MIKAINTKYDGNLFRSRLEARWAVFFNQLGINYEYEKEGYVVNGKWYLPDFYLPQNRWFIEVKGGNKPVDKELLQDLANESLKNVLVFRNIPSGCSPDMATIFLRDNGGGDLDYTWRHDYGVAGGRATSVHYCDSCKQIFTPFCHFEITPDLRCPLCLSVKGTSGNEIGIALDTARQARFEHGAKGIPV